MAKPSKSVAVLDGLPDHILCHILSFLPTKEAARTSVLSPRWRYLFLSSISILDFKSCLTPPTKDNNSFLNFVDRFFSNPRLLNLELECFRVNDLWVNYDPSINEFLMPFDDDPWFAEARPWGGDYLLINRWICAALRGVKEVGISLINKDVLSLPNLLFTSHSLVTLKLKIRGANDVPTDACLPNLRTLHFEFFEFLDGRSVLKLISTCPVLEDFAFVMCQFHEISELIIHNLSLKRLVLDFGELYADSHRGFNAIKIDAPNLVYFKYVNGMAGGCTLSETKTLERADIEMTVMDNGDGERVTNLLRGVCNVRSLYLAIEDDSRTFFLAPLDPMFAFNNLVELEFRNRYNVDWQGSWIVELLHCMPNLKTLILNLASTTESFRSLPNTVPWCLLFQIKEIEIKHFAGEEHMFAMVSYFLKHATIIEKLIIRDIGASTVIEKLSSLPKKSEKCEIVTR
ncbi:hypothetical protein V6N13_136716 [Hibiscus sabdariffa]|uniref:F-box domain-containing protein n=1 Tax=Hibiscus sabdariffa TaxID=183260 RepID=A0ABR2DMS1_9ROSI